jgi:hypothetical protein
MFFYSCRIYRKRKLGAKQRRLLCLHEACTGPILPPLKSTDGYGDEGDRETSCGHSISPTTIKQNYSNDSTIDELLPPQERSVVTSAEVVTIIFARFDTRMERRHFGRKT